MVDKMYYVGKILATHGIKGEVKVLNESDFDRFVVGNVLYVKKNNKYVKIEIDSVREHKNLLLIAFNKHTNINEILDYVGLEIYTNQHDELETGFYYDDLIGCMCYDSDKELGLVNDIIEMPNGVLLEVNINNCKKLIPFVDEFIINVDIKNKKINIKVIEGLL